MVTNKVESRKLKEISFDYNLLAKKLLEQMPGGLKAIALQNFVDEYLAYVERNRAVKTLEGVRLVCKYLLSYFSPLRSIETIKLKDAECYLDSLKKSAPKGVYNYHRVLKAMWNKAIQWNYIRENPFEKIKLKKRQRISPAFVTEEQLELILCNDDNEVVKDFTVTAFFTSCRLGELTQLTWRDINLKDKLIIIGNTSFQTKSRKQRVIPIHFRVEEILIKRFPKIIKREKHYVFCKSNGYCFTTDYFSKRFKRACRKAGMDEALHFHCLRHSFASSLVQRGVPLYSIKELLGHSSISCTEIYSHLNLNSLRDAISKLN